jgi:DNA-binding transcriptional LysR family regulator
LEFTSSDTMAELIDNGRTDIAIGPRPTCTEAHVEVFVHYDPDNGMAVWVDQLAADHGIVLDPVLRTRSPRTAAQLAAAGMGVTIVPVSALAPRPTGVVRRLRPVVKRDVIAVVAAPSDRLVQQFVADIRRRGTPRWAGPTP